MPDVEVTFDDAGFQAILNSDDVAAAVHDLAVEVASNVRSAEPDAEDVVVDDYRTDRRASSVTIRDARGRIWQVRDGLLTRAAAGAGLTVRRRR